MYKRHLTILIFLISLFCIVASSYAFEFSADTVMTSEGHKMTGKIYAKSDRFRMEVTKPEHMITITRMDKKVVWNIMPSEKMYMEMPFDPRQAPKTEIIGEIDRKLMGSETIDGHPTKKYLITYRDGKRTDKVYQWWATDINFPVKTADVNNHWVQEYKNIKLGSQPNSLFEVPSGYSKMNMPAMPGGMNFR
ncbi:MAG: DUF4412 domain-containing protein [Nitrospirota bacterium]